MKKILILLFLVINSSFLFSQIPLTIEGSVVNNAEQSWSGVNITRNAPTAFIYRNNSITSVNSSVYMLQAGDEDVVSSNNNLAGEVITGNKLTWNGTNISSVITHGIFTGYNINAVIKYNYLNKVPMGIIRKSNGMTNTSGGVAYNIVNRTSAVGTVVKGMNNVNIYNNTYYSNEVEYTGENSPGTWRGVIDIYENDALSPAVPSTGTKIKNNIFYTKNKIAIINIYQSSCLPGFESDYNVFYCEAGTPMFGYLGSAKTFAQWQALGYDAHSVVINPNFRDFTDFVPASRLDYGTDLGATWQAGLSTTATWTPGSSPATSNQNGKWQVGARIYDASSPNISYVSSAIANATPALLEITYNLTLANIIPPASAFSVKVNTVTRFVNKVTISGTKVTLTLASPVVFGDAATVAYTKPAANPLQTATGVQGESFAAQSVVNNTVAVAANPAIANIKLTVSPNPVYKIVNVISEYPGSTSAQIAALSPQIMRIYDMSGKLFMEKLLVTGITNIQIPINLRSGIYNVQISAAGVVKASQKIIVHR